MVKFTIEKSELAEAAIVMSAVANVKSQGAAPTDSMAVYLTISTMTLVISNEANRCVIKDIPIAVVEGEIGQHTEQAYMINTRKFASIIKNSTKTIQFKVAETQISISAGKRRFDLAVHTTIQKDIIGINLMPTPVNTKEILPSFINANTLTSQVNGIAEFIGTLFVKNMLLTSDRISALYIKDCKVFPDDQDIPDIVIATDLFAAVLPKIKETSAYVGFTTDGQELVFQIDNITLAKRCLENKFPKVQLLEAIDSIVHTENPNAIIAKVSMKEFMDKLHEIKEIVEADQFFLTFNKADQSISIQQNNTAQNGTEGEVLVDAEITMPEGVVDGISDKFSYVHLDMFNKVFAKEKELTFITEHRILDNDQVLKQLCVKTDDKAFFCTPLK